MFLAIVAVLGIGLAATSKPAYRLRRNRAIAGLLATGYPAMAIGFLLGPRAIGVIPDEPLQDAMPIAMIGLGWIGVMVGLQLRRDLISALPREVRRLTIADAIASSAVFGGLAALLLPVWTGQPDPATWWLGVALIGGGSIGWSMETRSLRRTGTSPAGDRLSLAVRAGGAVGGISAILVFGVASDLVVRDASGGQGFDLLAAAITIAITIVLAVALGIFGRYFLDVAGRQREHQLVVFIGIVVFAAGVATEMGLSPLMGAMLTGVVIANLAGDRLRGFERFILKAEHTVAVLFSVLAGILLDERIGWGGLAIVAAIVLARLAIKPALAAAVLRSTRAEDDRRGLPPLPRASAIYLGAARQSPLIAAMAVGLVLTEPSIYHQRLLAIVVFAGMICEIVALTGGANQRRRMLAREQPDPAFPAEPNLGASA